MVKNNIVIENARIGFRNFKGEPDKFNAKGGQRSFCVFLDSELGKVLESDGWNVRWLKPRDEDDEATPYLSVKVNFGNIPPKIVLVTRRGKTLLDESTVGALDWAEIASVDLTIKPYNWDVNGKQGVKAYLKNLYVTIVEDEFESKYLDVPDDAKSLINNGD